MEEIVSIFEGMGYSMEHFPADEGGVEQWQHDGGLHGAVISITPYTSMLRKRSVRVQIDLAGGESFQDSFPLDELDAPDLKDWSRNILST